MAPSPSDGSLHASDLTEALAARSTRGRWILAATVLGSGMALLDSTVVNIALRTIGRDMGASIAQLQWVVNAYLVALASLILVSGSLGDRFGRRWMFMLGVAWFATASALCALAPSPDLLIAARLLQGVGAALLTPESLALIQASFRSEDRGRVIGRWAGLGAIAAAVGPLLGGWIVDSFSWRFVFWINVPVAVVVLLISARHVPESRDPETVPGFDVLGAVCAVLGLGGITFALIEGGAAPAGLVGGSAAAGVAALALFGWQERRSPHPLLPLPLFGSLVFSVANGMTMLVYAGLGAVLFFLALQLQVSSGYSPLAAGLSTLPITLALLLLSSSSGALASKIGPRWQLTVGPLLCGTGVLLLRNVDRSAPYLTAVLPGVVLFALGLATLVAPLTATVLAAAPDRSSGLASGINNAVARTGTLLAVAALPALVGVNGQAYQHPEVFTSGYSLAMTICAGLLFVGGAVTSSDCARPGARPGPITLGTHRSSGRGARADLPPRSGAPRRPTRCRTGT